MIKNIVFDIGNVLLEFNPRKYFAKYFNDETLANALCDAMLSGATWNKYDLGEYSLKQVEDEIVVKNPQYKDLIHEMLSIWVKILEPIDYSLEKMRLLKRRGYKIYLLSNLNKEAYEYIKENTFLFKEVDGYIVSFKEHMIKPNQEIYACLCNRYRLNPNECIFIDDLDKNVEAAKQYGMQGIVFNEIKQVEKELQVILESEIVC